MRSPPYLLLLTCHTLRDRFRSSTAGPAASALLEPTSASTPAPVRSFSYLWHLTVLIQLSPSGPANGIEAKIWTCYAGLTQQVRRFTQPGLLMTLNLILSFSTTTDVVLHQ